MYVAILIPIKPGYSILHIGYCRSMYKKEVVMNGEDGLKYLY